jgi:hypothetical protein
MATGTKESSSTACDIGIALSSAETELHSLIPKRDRRNGLGGKYTGTWSDSRKDGRLYEKEGTSKTEVWVNGFHEEQGPTSLSPSRSIKATRHT